MKPAGFHVAPRSVLRYAPEMSEPIRMVPSGPAAAHVKAPPPPGFTLVHVTARAAGAGSKQARARHSAAVRSVHAGKLGGRGAKAGDANRRRSERQDKFARPGGTGCRGPAKSL